METHDSDKRAGDKGKETAVAGLAMSEAAGAYLSAMLDENSAGDVIRFVFGFEGLELQPSAVLPGDTTFDWEGRTVLVLDQLMVDMLGGKTLDIEETDDGTQLRLF